MEHIRIQLSLKIKSAISKFLVDFRNFALPAGILLCYLLLCLFFRFTVCPIRHITGLPCPGCGVTRALLLLLQGHFAASFSMHPFGIILIGYGILFFFFRYFTNYKGKAVVYIGYGLAVFMLLFYIYRMIRFFPHTAPMQYDETSILAKLWHMLFHRQ